MRNGQWEIWKKLSLVFLVASYAMICYLFQGKANSIECSVCSFVCLFLVKEQLCVVGQCAKITSTSRECEGPCCKFFLHHHQLNSPTRIERLQDWKKNYFSASGNKRYLNRYFQQSLDIGWNNFLDLNDKINFFIDFPKIK